MEPAVADRLDDTGWFDRQLEQIIVVSIADGLLVRNWAPTVTWPDEAVTPYVADLYKRVTTLVTAASSGSSIRAITLELEHELVIIQEVWPGYAATFVYPPSTPMGLARLETRRTMPWLRQLVWQLNPKA